jgi:hypothetical protein
LGLGARRLNHRLRDISALARSMLTPVCRMLRRRRFLSQMIEATQYSY